MKTMTFKDLKNGDGYLSYETREKLNLKDSDLVVNFAYTDYGGDFFDRVCIQYFEENYSDIFVSEHTACYGKNGVLFGDISAQFIEATENYLLGFEDIEEYYCEKEREAEEESFSRFLKDENFKDFDNCFEWLCENKGGYYSILPSGDVDFSYIDLKNELIEEGFSVEAD